MPETDQTLAPAWRTLLEYERLNLDAGHENAGFLSSTHGYLPRAPPLARLDARFASWDDVVRELPLLYRDVHVRQRLDALDVLSASEADLPDSQVLRACALLGILAHAYWHSDCRPARALPDAISHGETSCLTITTARPVLQRG